nr:uncharacterized protein LOC110358223 isoform X3 [Columba livia]
MVIGGEGGGELQVVLWYVPSDCCLYPFNWSRSSLGGALEGGLSTGCLGGTKLAGCVGLLLLKKKHCPFLWMNFNTSKRSAVALGRDNSLMCAASNTFHLRSFGYLCSEKLAEVRQALLRFQPLPALSFQMQPAPASPVLPGLDLDLCICQEIFTFACFTSLWAGPSLADETSPSITILATRRGQTGQHSQVTRQSSCCTRTCW